MPMKAQGLASYSVRGVQERIPRFYRNTPARSRAARGRIRLQLPAWLSEEFSRGQD
jgi:hypothetical protein